MSEKPMVNDKGYIDVTSALKLREEYQYSTEVTLKDKEYEDLLELAKRILDVSKGVVEE